MPALAAANHGLLNDRRSRPIPDVGLPWKGQAMRVTSRSRRSVVVLLLAALVVAVAITASKTEPQPWSPEADKICHEIYGPIIDGG
jgi:hypothetical protein